MEEKINIEYTIRKNYYAVTTDKYDKPMFCQHLGEFPDWIRTFEDGKTFAGSGMNAAKDKADQICKDYYMVYDEVEMNLFSTSIGQALAEGAKTLFSSRDNQG